MKLAFVSPKKKIIAVSAIVTISLFSAVPSYALDIGGLFDNLISDLNSYVNGIVTDSMAQLQQEFPELQNLGDLIATGSGGNIDISKTVDNIYQELNKPEENSDYGGGGLVAEIGSSEATNNLVYSTATGVISEPGQQHDVNTVDSLKQAADAINTTNNNKIQPATSTQDAVKGLADVVAHLNPSISSIASTEIEVKKLIAQGNIATTEINEKLLQQYKERKAATLGTNNEIISYAAGLNLQTTAAP